MKLQNLNLLKRIKKAFFKIIENRVREFLNEKLSKINNPYNISFEDESSNVLRPNIIIGGEHIQIGSKSSIGNNAWLAAYDSYMRQRFQPRIQIGNQVNIGNFACITAIEEIVIEDGCLLSEFVYISDHYHGYDAAQGIPPVLQPLYSKGPVRIGENSFIGLRVSILPGVTLGKHCVVGSNSVVTKSFPDYCMIAGIPAKIIKTFDFNKREWVSIN